MVVFCFAEKDFYYCNMAKVFDGEQREKVLKVIIMSISKDSVVFFSFRF